MEYNDFVLRISPSNEPNRFVVNATSATAGEATGAFVSPFSETELKLFVLEMGLTRRGVRGISSPQWRAAQSFGEKLFRQLFSEDIRSTFLSSRNDALRENKGLRVKFIIDAPALTNYPWEFLFDPSLKQFLSLYEATPFVRYLELPVPPKVLRVAPPLRVLVVASSPTDYPQLDLAREKNNLDSALAVLVQQNQITVDWLPNPNLEALRSQLLKRSYHIFHFIGHGGFDEAAQDGVLIFEDESKRSRTVSGEQLAYLLGNHLTLQLAVLNACEGARTSVQDPFAGTAMTLVRSGGVAAVVAMQFEITDEASIQFARGFYEGVALGKPIDAAVTQARLAVFTQGNYLEWATPVLYLRAPDGVIFAPVTIDASAQLERERAEQARREKERVETERVSHEKVEQERVAKEERAKSFPGIDTKRFTGKPITVGLIVLGALVFLCLALFGVYYLTRDRTAPVIDSVQPSDGSSVLVATTISVSAAYRDESGIDRTRVKLVIDGSDVTSLTAIGDTKASYTGPFVLGSHAVQIQIADRNGNVTDKGWSFTVTDVPVPTATNPSVPIATPTPTPTAIPRQPTSTPTPGIGSTRVSPIDGATMMFVPAGDFLMGSTDQQVNDAVQQLLKDCSGCSRNSYDDEKPQHTVSLDAFWIDKFEVTNARYKKCVDAGKCSPPTPTKSYTRDSYYGNAQYDNYPVIFVSWNDANAYCAWAGKYLSSEAQWEKAARGTDGRIYPWGNAFDQSRLNSGYAVGDTTAVGNYPSGASSYGVLDMAGNVWEWVNDWYSETYYQSSPRNNPTGPILGQYRLFRGGAWFDVAYLQSAALRNRDGPGYRRDGLGFRCAD